MKPSVFNNQTQELHTDPFHSEDPFKTDPFKGSYSSSQCSSTSIYLFRIFILLFLDSIYLMFPFLWIAYLFPACVALWLSSISPSSPSLCFRPTLPSASFFSCTVGDPFQNDPFAKQPSASTGTYMGEQNSGTSTLFHSMFLGAYCYIHPCLNHNLDHNTFFSHTKLLEKTFMTHQS